MKFQRSENKLDIECTELSAERLQLSNSRGKTETITGRPAQVLSLLWKNSPEPVSSEEFQAIWNRKQVFDGNLSVAITTVRKKLNEFDPRVGFGDNSRLFATKNHKNSYTLILTLPSADKNQYCWISAAAVLFLVLSIWGGRELSAPELFDNPGVSSDENGSVAVSPNQPFVLSGNVSMQIEFAWILFVDEFGNLYPQQPVVIDANGYWQATGLTASPEMTSAGIYAADESAHQLLSEREANFDFTGLRQLPPGMTALTTINLIHE